MRAGQSFKEQDVAEYYRYRPDYPVELFEKLYALSPRHHSALDLGCGPGKVARRIGKDFGSVTAVDASASMLSIARRLQVKEDTNISWVCGLAEEVEFEDSPFDLIIAAASIHWMDHAVLFPRLFNHVTKEHVFAVVNGDDAYQPPWQKGWDDFLSKWILELTGQPYEQNRPGSQFTRKMESHRQWLDLRGTDSIEHTLSQSVEDFILCQFSRDTFAPSKLGHRIEEFSTDLR